MNKFCEFLKRYQKGDDTPNIQVMRCVAHDSAEQSSPLERCRDQLDATRAELRKTQMVLQDTQEVGAELYDDFKKMKRERSRYQWALRISMIFIVVFVVFSLCATDWEQHIIGDDLIYAKSFQTINNHGLIQNSDSSDYTVECLLKDGKLLNECGVGDGNMIISAMPGVSYTIDAYLFTKPDADTRTLEIELPRIIQSGRKKDLKFQWYTGETLLNLPIIAQNDVRLADVEMTLVSELQDLADINTYLQEHKYPGGKMEEVWMQHYQIKFSAIDPNYEVVITLPTGANLTFGLIVAALVATMSTMLICTLLTLSGDGYTDEEYQEYFEDKK